jgi:hypothetical protein
MKGKLAEWKREARNCMTLVGAIDKTNSQKKSVKTWTMEQH